MATDRDGEDALLDDDPLWYKDAVLYEVHVRAFADGNGDGVGDFKGLTARLDYLRDLGVTAIWVLPFYPSPGRDDGYDIADYTGVHPAYGTLRDVGRLVREAHRRGLRVITELVCNHTSDQHPWFQRARRAPPGSVWRDFYVWSDTPAKYKDARIIFQDFETSNWTWDPVAGAYFWHRFYSQQPDLNYDNPRVRQEILKVVDFWLSMGVDGLRLDAVPYLYERDGTSCENLPETHDFLRALRAHIDAHFPNRMLLAEANQWPETAASYFGEGDECHLAFHFPLMPRMFMAVRMEDRFPIVDILAQTPAIPANAQWTLFLRNHDELTLEMVTDEERDFMYRAYATDPQARINLGIRRRLAPLLGNHRRRIELLYGLLFSLPGTPAIYYGDEIGMGDNIYLGDRNGVRTPMQWNASLNAGFSTANRQRLYLPVVEDPEYHYQSVNVENQEQNPHSLLAWLRRLIALRRRHRAFSRGEMEILHPENRRILAFVRRLGDERILVVANLSRFAQFASLDLSAFDGATPVEVFGRTDFPVIGTDPYPLTLGPHAFMWFSLETQAGSAVAASAPPVAGLAAATLDGALERARRADLAEAMSAYVRGRRWFGGRAKRVTASRIVDVVRSTARHGRDWAVILLELAYDEGDPETYLVPIAMARGEAAAQLADQHPQAMVARLAGAPDGAIVYDGLWDPSLRGELWDVIGRRRRLHGERGILAGVPTPTLRHLRGTGVAELDATLGHAEQSNSSVMYGDLSILKVLRRLEAGVHPEVEVGRLLAEGDRFRHVAPLHGALEYRVDDRATTAGILFGYVPHQGDAWEVAQRELVEMYERVRGQSPDDLDLGTGLAPWQMVPLEPPASLAALAGEALRRAHLLGQRTAEMHAALARPPLPAAFAPEPFTGLYQRGLHQSVRNLAHAVGRSLDRAHPDLPTNGRIAVTALRDALPRLGARLDALLGPPIAARRQRCHGDFHLGQVLVSGDDLVIIDFEGEPARPLSDRRGKASPLRDVAGMLRSYEYAAWAPLVGRPEEDRAALEAWAMAWARWNCAAFLKGYLDGAAAAPDLVPAGEGMASLLEVYLLEKALYEVRYELASRPGWVEVPVRGLLARLELA